MRTQAERRAVDWEGMKELVACVGWGAAVLAVFVFLSSAFPTPAVVGSSPAPTPTPEPTAAVAMSNPTVLSSSGWANLEATTTEQSITVKAWRLIDVSHNCKTAAGADELDGYFIVSPVATIGTVDFSSGANRFVFSCGRSATLGPFNADTTLYYKASEASVTFTIQSRQY